MPPIALKIKGNKSFFPLSNLDSEEDLSKTWRVCTKVKDSLENGSRLENLSWRLWHYNEKCNNGTFQSLSKTTAMKLDHHQVKFRPLKNKKKKSNNDSNITTNQKQQTPTSLAMVMPQEQQQSQQPTSPSIVYPFGQQQHLTTDGDTTEHHLDGGFDQALVQLQQRQSDRLHSSSSSPSSYLTKQPPLMIDTNQTTNQYMLNQFTSDQTNDSPMVELDSLFGVAFDHGSGFLQQAGTGGGAVDLMMDDSTWNLGSGAASAAALATTPSFANSNSNNHYFTPVTSPLESSSYHLPVQTSSSTTHYQQQQQQQSRSYASSPTTATNYNMSLSMPSSPTSYLPHHNNHNHHHPRHHHSATSNEAMYVSSSSSMPPPTSTLGSKLFANYSLKEDQRQLSHSSSTINLSGDDFSLGNMPGLTNCDLTSTPNNATAAVTPNTAEIDSLHHHNLFPASTTPATPPSHTPSSSSPSEKAVSTKSHTVPEIADPVCTNCGATSTPLWRRSFEDEVLCNACGLYEKLHNTPRPKTLKPHNARKEVKEEEIIQLVCSNCSTTTTPLWRRDDGGASLCNACGLYYKLHHEKRPLSMKTDIIKKRQRYESSSGTHGNGRKANKKMKGETSAAAVTSHTVGSSSSSTSSHSAPPSPATTIGNQTPAATTMSSMNSMDDDYHTNHDVYPVSTASSPSPPSSPSGHSILPYSYIQQHHLPAFMNSG